MRTVIEIMQICEEMVKLRKMLDAKGIVWIDKTCVTPDEVMSKMKELMPDVEEKYFDATIFRTHFAHNGNRYSVIFGYGTYGNNENLLELMADCINNGEPVGYMTADEVLQLVLKEGGK